MNTNLKLFGLVIIVGLVHGCTSSKTDNFPMEKPYWDVKDYDNAISEIEFRTPVGEKYPTLADPETAPIFKKLIDQKNISVVVEDDALGIRHRADFTDDMFQEYQDLANLYHAMDREDKFIYDRELVEILRFGLYLQIHYFKIGNDKIRQESDNSEQVKDVIRRNEQVIISNFNNYLDFVNHEKSFSEESLQSYAAGIDESFAQLIATFPNGSYNNMISKATDMDKKAVNPGVKKAMANLISELKTKMKAVAVN